MCRCAKIRKIVTHARADVLDAHTRGMLHKFYEFDAKLYNKTVAQYLERSTESVRKVQVGTMHWSGSVGSV